MANKEETLVFHVSSTTNVSNLAGAVLANRVHGKTIVLRYVGAGAGHQALKAVIIINAIIEKSGELCYIKPSFAHSKDKGSAVLQKLIFTHE